MPENWYAVHTRSNFEKIVERDLTAKGLVTYCPGFAAVHQWADRRKLIEKPVFPGYVFVRVNDPAACRLQILQSRGAVRLLGQAGAPEAIPDREIDAVRRVIESGRVCVSHPFLREGSWVRIRGGPLRNVEGRLVRFKTRSRLVLSVDALAQSMAVEVDLTEVEEVSPRGSYHAPGN